MRRKNQIAAAIALGLIVMGSVAPSLHAHGEVPDKMPENAAHLIQPALPGADAFLDAIIRHSFYQFNASQMALIDDIRKHRQFAQEISQNLHSDLGSKDADYHRSLAQDGLLDLLGHHLPDIVELDFSRGMPAHDVMNPVSLPTLEGIVIFKVITGPDSPVLSVERINLTRSGDGGPFTLHIQKSGTSYILVSFTEVPSDLSRMVIPLQVVGESQPRYWTGISIESPVTGQLELKIADEEGASTPALVRLVHKPSGKLFAPSNAVDIWPIMTSVRGIPESETVQPYMHYFLNMNLRGNYWIVPEASETALPAGDWELYIMRGIEYEPVITNFSIKQGKRTKLDIQLKRWINMPERGWYSGDDHVHARMMSSKDADDIMAFVQAADIKVANILEMGDPMRTYYEQRGFGKAWRVQDDGHVLVPGQEDPRSHWGHAIGMNLTQLARDLDKYMLNDWVADEIHRQGGLYGYTHVGEGGLGVHRDMTMTGPRGKADFGSIMQNILGTERYWDFLNLGFKLTASAGSDVPYGGAVGITRLYAYIGEETPFSADAWFDAVKAGNTFVTNGPMLDLKVNDAMPGDEIVTTDATPLRIRASASGMANMTAPASLSLVKNGVVIKQIRPSNPKETELKLDMDLDPGTGCWIAIMAQGLDGTQAHTTPVYVHRKGFRHWNLDQADQLIGQRLQILEEIEAIVREQMARKANGSLQPLEFSNVLIADQGEEVLQRTKLVRGMYEELKKTARKERDAIR
ncbi:MAG: CehA/McbA family metallohydrolase [Puniceicoccaceae bacterium]